MANVCHVASVRNRGKRGRQYETQKAARAYICDTPWADSSDSLCSRIVRESFGATPKFVTALCFVYRCFTSRRSPVVVYFVVFELVGGERGECRRCLGDF